MDVKTKKKFNICPVRLGVTMLALLIELLYELLRSRPAALAWVSSHIARPWHRLGSGLCASLPLSVAELVFIAVALFVIAYLIRAVVLLIKRPQRWHRVYATVLTLLMLAAIYSGGSRLLWSVCYYEPDFSERSGVSAKAVSTQALTETTRYFAQLANTYAPEVPRNADGVCDFQRGDVLDSAAEVFRGASALYPFLEGRECRPKTIMCSKVMSVLGFTGFFFPLTGEANLNIDYPVSLLPSTAEHELAHQRGVAAEEECNFVAVLACTESDDPIYIYSGALLAYTYLGNALSGADRDAWSEIYATLRPEILADFAANRAYWAQFEDNIVEKASDKVYDAFLKTNGLEDGIKNYGACVDLLVNYYTFS